MHWYVARNGVRQGPMDESAVRAMAASGELKPSDLVWHTGEASWREARLLNGMLPPAQEPDPAPPTRPGNYFIRHWRGDLSLPVSYWVSGLGSTLLVLLCFAALTGMDWTETPELVAGTYAAAILLAIVLSVWQLVGVWRSAEKHPSRGGSPGWATAAKAAVVLGCLRTVVDLSTTIVPQLGELWNIVNGDQALAGATLRVLRDASELEISGPIGFGLTGEVQKALDAHPTITVVHLSSEGGRVEEAKKLAVLFLERGLATHVSNECLSACTLAYLGGSVRTINADGRLGFHSSYFPGLDAVALAKMNSDGLEFMVSRGVQRDFARRAFDTPPDQMWYPDATELLSAGAVTRVASADEVAISGIKPSDLDRLRAELDKNDLFAALKEHEPDTYAAVMATVEDGFRRGRSIAEIRADTLPQLQAIYVARLPHASDEAVVAMTRVVIAQLQELNSSDGALCAEYLRGDSLASADAGMQLSLELRGREMAAGGSIIRTAATSRFDPLSRTEMEQRLDPVILALTERWGDDVALLAEIGKAGSGADPGRLCAIAIDLYQTIVAMPDAEAGPLLRTLYAG